MPPASPFLVPNLFMPSLPHAPAQLPGVDHKETLLNLGETPDQNSRIRQRINRANRRGGAMAIARPRNIFTRRCFGSTPSGEREGGKNAPLQARSGAPD
jgi:hypothetical protein